MSERLDLREAGDGALLLQLAAVVDPAVNARAIAIAARLRQLQLVGVRDVLPTFCTVAVHFDPLKTDAETVARALRDAASAAPEVRTGRHHEVPVSYGREAGPDLEFVAEQAGLSPAEVIRRHTAVQYRVFMLGFQPGFAYLGLVDPLLLTPRRSSPRLRVPAGSVGIAGRQTAVYPATSPGGWQLVGRALEPVFDIQRDEPRFAPGDSVTFVPTASDVPLASTTAAPAPLREGARRVTVLSPGLFTTVQDGGAWGRQDRGFPVSGAMDRFSHAVANIAVGNRPDAAALEVTIAGPELRVEQMTTVAVAGAEMAPTLDGAPVPRGVAVLAPAGSVLRFGSRRAGARTYVAFDGGIQQVRRWPVMPLGAGSVVSLNAAEPLPPTRVAVDDTMPAGGARLRILPGPQDDQLPSACLDALVATRFTVSPQSNRIGYRLMGALVPSTPGEMISDATFDGGIQVTPSGQPILLMADRQTTGGYPQVATVISADLSIAAQLAPGDWVEFVMCTRAEAVAALMARHDMLPDVS